MTAKEIQTLRESLGLTQAHFGLLLGVHGVTVSRWERETTSPNAWQSSILHRIKDTLTRAPRKGRGLLHKLMDTGPAAVLSSLL